MISLYVFNITVKITAGKKVRWIMSQDFKVNDTVMYGLSGVCTVDDVKEESFGDMEPRIYYVLSPVKERGTLFVPVDSTPSKIRPLVTKNEIDSIIKSCDDPDKSWIPDDKRRRTEYTKALSFGSTQDIFGIYQALTNRAKKTKVTGKKIHTSDASILENARKVISKEFSYVLDIPSEEVESYIDDNKAS